MGMSKEEELARIASGPAPGERPDDVLIDLQVRAPGRADDVLRRARTVLTNVLEHIDERPTSEAWRRLLPEWFVQRFVPERTQDEAERWLDWWRTLSPEEKARAQEQSWTLLDWLYWFEPEQRTWSWWNATIRDKDTFRLAIAACDSVTPLAAFKWLFRASGAEQISSLPERGST
jgi:hypothetical protein